MHLEVRRGTQAIEDNSKDKWQYPGIMNYIVEVL